MNDPYGEPDITGTPPEISPNRGGNIDDETPPWLRRSSLPKKPPEVAFGYFDGKKLYASNAEGLVKTFSHITRPQRYLVWTPESPYMVPPETVSFLSEIVLKNKQKRLKQKLLIRSIGTVIGAAAFLVTLMVIPRNQWGEYSRIIQMVGLGAFFIGVLPQVAVVWEWYYNTRSRKHKAMDTLQLAQFQTWLQSQPVKATQQIAFAIGVVGVAQLSSGIGPSIVDAGLIKELFRQGQWWRMVSCIFVHGGMLHFFFNVSALMALGRQLEILGHRSLLFTTFIISGIVGSLFSIVLMPEANTVGASGGLLGMIGFLAVLGIKRRKLLPPDYVKSILISTGLIGSIGIIGYELIDNAAHLGGFLTGVALGLLWVKNRPKRLPLKIPEYVKRLGDIAQYVIYGAVLLTVLLIVK